MQRKALLILKDLKYISVTVVHAYVYTQHGTSTEGLEISETPGAKVTGSCALPTMRAGNQT